MQELMQFLFEIGYLKNVSRSGWWLLGNKIPESVAEHSFRCAIIGYFLAKSEGLNTFKVVMMCLFHDIHEARINDLHKIAQNYMNFKETEKEASQDQIRSLKNPERKEIEDMLIEFLNHKSKESIVAKDADILECAMQAREYQVQGYEAAIDWIERAKSTLRSKSAKRLLSTIEHSDPNEWWKRLKDK